MRLSSDTFALGEGPTRGGLSHMDFYTAAASCASSRHSILRLWRGPSPRAYSRGLSHMGFHAACRIVSCSVIMLTRSRRYATIIRRVRPWRRANAFGDYLTWAFIPLRRIVPLRGTLSCAFGAALLQGPTRGDYLTWAFMPLRRILPLQGTLSCAFGAALLQGPTRGRNILVPSHSFFISFSDGVK